jgi:hypothetical protein
VDGHGVSHKSNNGYDHWLWDHRQQGDPGFPDHRRNHLPGGTTVTARITLTAKASQDVVVALFADTVWPTVRAIAAPIKAAIPGQAVVQAGDDTVDVNVDTQQVEFPLTIMIRASINNNRGRTAEFTLLPPDTADLGRNAEDRVQAILDMFLQAPPRDALSSIISIRQTSAEASSDIYLAAADHYLNAFVGVLDAPESLFEPYVAGIRTVIVGYELAKLFDIFGVLNESSLPASPASRLSLEFGPRGVTDALKSRLSVPVRGRGSR